MYPSTMPRKQILSTMLRKQIPSRMSGYTYYSVATTHIEQHCKKYIKSK
jgi:hypothetical protein